MSKTKIYLDMDGVLTDFDGAVESHGIVNKNDFIHKPRSEWTEEQKNLSLAVEALMDTEEFWSEMKPNRYATGLFQFASTLGDVWILTARPSVEGSEWVSEVKENWIKKYYGNVPFVCCLRHEKKEYAAGNILVDDMKKNCEEWEEAGGKAIHWQ